MERIDLGDNSAKFIIQPSDTLSTIHTLLTAFMAFRGWSLISTVGTVASTQFTAVYTSMTLGGSMKRIKFLYGTEGNTLRLGIAVANEVDKTVGLAFSDFIGDSFSGIYSHLIRSGSAQILYVFASPQWCYATATSSETSIIKTLTTNQYRTSDTCYDVVSRQDGSVYYSRFTSPLPFTRDGNVMSVNGHIVSRNVSSYNGQETLLPSIYAHCAQRYRYTNDKWQTSYIIGTVNDGGTNVTFQKAGVTGCCELLDTDSTSPFVYVDTCGLMQRPLVDDQIEYALMDALNMNKRNHGISSLLEPARGKGTVCLTAGDPREFSDINLGKALLKFGGKNLLQNIQLSSNSIGYNGVMYGIFATQADYPANFMQEVFLRVDEHYKISDTGEIRKFFVIPGYSRLYGNFNRRRWRNSAYGDYSQDHIYWQGVYEGNPSTGYRRGSSSTRSSGLWVDNNASFDIKQYDSFLIPA